MSMVTHSHTEATFESAIGLDLLAKGYAAVDKSGFDRERAIFPAAAIDFIRETQPNEWANLDALRASAERTMALLKERRAALIAAAVTGSIKVTASEADGGLAAVV